MGFVVIAGRFEPGTSVSLYEVADETVLRVDGATVLAGRRIADTVGSVGFDGLQEGARFIAVGFGIEGTPLQLRCRSLAAGEDGALTQAPNPEAPQLVGTEEVVPPVEAPAEPFAMLQTGVPAGVPIDVALAA